MRNEASTQIYLRSPYQSFPCPLAIYGWWLTELYQELSTCQLLSTHFQVGNHPEGWMREIFPLFRCDFESHHGLQTLLLKRYYFKDEMFDQLYLADRVLQNVLLQQLKPTFPYVMNPNCYHLHGPSGVQLATQKIWETVATEHYKYIIRADIKSYYKSIQHHVLIEDIKRYFFDTKVQLMLEQIVRNSIEMPR